mgnify:FL=1
MFIESNKIELKSKYTDQIVKIYWSNYQRNCSFY